MSNRIKQLDDSDDDMFMSARYGQVSVDEFAMHAPPSANPGLNAAGDAKRRFDWAEAMFEESQRRLLNEEHEDVLQRLTREFGQDCVNNPKERAARLLEETLEHAQAAGLTVDEVIKQVRYTLSKPANADPVEELADLWVTLLMAAACYQKQIYDLEQGAKSKLADKPEGYFTRRAQMKRFNGSLSFMGGASAANDIGVDRMADIVEHGMTGIDFTPIVDPNQSPLPFPADLEVDDAESQDME